MTKLRRALKGVAIAVALVGTALGTISTAGAQSDYYSNDPYARDYNGGYYNNDPYSGYNREPYNNDRYGYDPYDNGRYGYGRERGNNVLSILLGSIAFGYRDGYWDHRHRWHHWRHNRDYRYYRDHGTHYYGSNHDSYDNNGWQPY